MPNQYKVEDDVPVDLAWADKNVRQWNIGADNLTQPERERDAAQARMQQLESAISWLLCQHAPREQIGFIKDCAGDGSEQAMAILNACTGGNKSAEWGTFTLEEQKAYVERTAMNAARDYAAYADKGAIDDN